MKAISSRGCVRRGLIGIAFASGTVVGIVGAAEALAGVRVAIVASAEVTTDDPRFTDPRNKLEATGFFDEVRIFNALLETPSLAQLERYDSLLVWSNRDFANAETLGNTLADFVDRGGGVVLSIFANTTASPNRFLAGRWLDQGYDIIPPGGGTLSSGGARQLGHVHYPSHPIMEGVTTFRGGAASFRPLTLDLTSHGVSIAEWSDTSTLVATSTRFRRRADLGMYPPSSAVLQTLWDPSSDGARLMGNALLFTARCRVDINRDGRVDFFDYLDFVDALEEEDPAADFDGNGVVDFFDYLEFLPMFVAGCD